MLLKRTKALFNGRLLDGLCDDALLLVLSYFTWEELLEIGLVNKRLRLCTLTNHDVFWRNFYLKREPAFRKLFENNPSMLRRGNGSKLGMCYLCGNQCKG